CCNTELGLKPIRKSKPTLTGASPKTRGVPKRDKNPRLFPKTEISSEWRSKSMHKAKATAFGLVVLAALVFVSNAKGQTNSFKKTILSSESQGSANVRSADLVNAWSMAHIAGTPAGVVANTGAGFKIEGMRSEFIEAGEDGTISGRLATNPMGIRAVDNSKMGAVYKGLALITDSSGAQMLLAANFHAGVVEAFDSNFAP